MARPFSLALAGALLLVLSFPRPALPFLAPLGIALLLAAFRGLAPRRAFLTGWAAGALWSALSLRWLAETLDLYGGIPTWAAVLLIILMGVVMGLWTGLFGALAARSTDGPLRTLLFLPPLWVLVETARVWIPVPFPWLQLGAAWSGWEVARPLLAAGGVPLLSLLTAGAGTALWACASLARRGSPRQAGALAGILSLSLLFAYGMSLALLPPPVPGTPLTVAVAQGNFRQEELWEIGRRDEILAVYLDLTRQAAERGATLVVWPESSLPFFLQADRARAEMVRAEARRLGVHLVFGGAGFDLEGTTRVLRNSAFHLSPDGELSRYDKTRLVPFGEYVPFPRLLFFVEKVVPGVGSFRPGRWEGPWPRPVPAGALVCYEVAFADIPRREARDGARILLNLTNDAWYGTSWGPYQHLAFASLRSAETNLPLLRAANTGISAIFDAEGRELGRLPLFTRGVLTARIAVPGPSATLSTRWGEWVVAVCAIWVIILLPAGRKTLPAPTG